MPDPVYRAHHSHLGDLWASANYFLRRSVAEGRCIQVSRWQHGQDLQPLLGEILSVLDSPGSVVISDAESTEDINGYDVWKAEYSPTKIRWRPGPHRRICYQLDGVSSADAKNPSPEELELLLSDWAPGYEFIRLGKHLSIEECVVLAAHSDLFFGVCSGMSHLCHSVGVPMFLLEYRLPLDTTHLGKDYTKVFSASGLIAKALAFLQPGPTMEYY